MHKKEIEKVYIKKIRELKKHDKAYFEHDNPSVSDKDYDDIKTEILNLEKKYNIKKAKILQAVRLVISHQISLKK